MSEHRLLPGTSYRCTACGFVLDALVGACPSCRARGTMRPGTRCACGRFAVARVAGRVTTVQCPATE